MSTTEIVEMSHEEWTAEAVRRFGPDPINWKFVCPVCGNVASGQQFKDAGASPDRMRCECIGRYTGGRKIGEKGDGPCDYAGYGLFRLSPIRVRVADGTLVHSFAFADLQERPKWHDPSASENGADHHTGQLCVECQDRPAGTAWSPLFCQPCNAVRMDRIDASFKKIEEQLDITESERGDV